MYICKYILNFLSLFHIFYYFCQVYMIVHSVHCSIRHTYCNKRLPAFCPCRPNLANSCDQRWNNSRCSWCYIASATNHWGKNFSSWIMWIQYTCIGVELYSCSTYHKGNARARSKEEHTVVSTLCCICIINMFNAP